MPSPFPGMDPYLESPAHWRDFHSRFINVLSELLGEQLPVHYHAQLNEQVLLIEPDESPAKEVGPDVALLRDRDKNDASTHAREPGIGLLEPTTIPNIVRLDPHIEIYIEVRHLPDQEVIAVIELLSPSNKGGSGRGQYLQKRDELLRRDVHLVELDFLRGGQRLRLTRRLPPDDYYCFLSRGDRRPLCDVYHWGVRQPLPTVPVPLRSPDPDVPLDLGEAFTAAYRRGRYQGLINYALPPPLPSFSQADADWVTRTASSAGQA